MSLSDPSGAAFDPRPFRNRTHRVDASAEVKSIAIALAQDSLFQSNRHSLGLDANDALTRLPASEPAERDRGKRGSPAPEESSAIARPNTIFSADEE